jgi:hypothetical protein
LRLEYEPDRGVLRIEGSERAEVKVADLVDELGIEVEELARVQRFLLFAGDGRSVGGAGDLVGAFHAETDARDAFVRLRASSHAAEVWAEVVAVEGETSSRQVCWFGPPERLRNRVRSTPQRPPNPLVRPAPAQRP